MERFFFGLTDCRRRLGARCVDAVADAENVGETVEEHI